MKAVDTVLKQIKQANGIGGPQDVLNIVKRIVRD